jgi:predicted nucleic-acid-binding Zn-ribbon protein
MESRNKSPEKKENKPDFTIDLQRIDGDGDFPCPKCGVIISPQDESEEIYGKLKAIMKGAELEALLLKCNKCGSTIKLVGF